MKSRPILATGFLSLIALGCSRQPLVIQPMASAPANSASNSSQNASSSTASTPQDDKFNAPEALARRTAAYTKDMQAMIDTKPVDPQASATPSTSPSITDDTAAPPVRITWDDSAALQQKNPLPADAMKSNAVKLESQRAQPEAPARAAAKRDENPPLIKSDKIDNAANAPLTIEPTREVAREAVRDGAREPIAAAAVIPPAQSSDLQQKVDHRVKDYPRDLSAHLDFQLLKFLEDDRVPDLATLSSLPTEDRELISSLVDGLSNFRNAIRADNNMLLSKKVRPLLEMADRLRGHADLSIPTVALCTRVQTYGEYDPIDPAQFAAGKDHPVILYCEVENFSSELDDQQRWQTKLTQESVLYTEAGLQVWSDKNEPIEDVSRHRRHDFFIVKRMTIPSSLAVGRYLLKVTVVDQQMSRVAEATVPIVIAVQ